MPTAEKGDSADLFKFKEPNGSIKLILSKNNKQEGWMVQAEREPIEVCCIPWLVIIIIVLMFYIVTADNNR